MRLFSLLFLYFLLLPGSRAQYPEFPPGEEGLEQMCKYLIEAEYKIRKKFTSQLMPGLQDCQAAFTEEKSRQIHRFTKRIHQRHVLALSPMNGLQSEVWIRRAGKSDFEAYNERARHFPGGYKEMAKYLREDVDYFLITFAEPGHKNGASFDLLAYVNGHWCLFLSPWVACMD